MRRAAPTLLALCGLSACSTGERAMKSLDVTDGVAKIVCEATRVRDVPDGDTRADRLAAVATVACGGAAQSRETYFRMETLTFRPASVELAARFTCDGGADPKDRLVTLRVCPHIIDGTPLIKDDG